MPILGRMTRRRFALAIIGLVAAGALMADAAWRRFGAQARPAGAVRYQLVVPPGGDPSAIRLDIPGAQRLEVDAAGDLLVRVGGRLLRPDPPRAFQTVNGTRRPIALQFGIASDGDLHLKVGAYDRSQPLVIEPLF